MQDSAASNPICLLQANAHGIGCLRRVEDFALAQSFGLLCLGVTAPLIPVSGVMGGVNENSRRYSS